MIIKSFAKINLSLKILSRREDNYHNLEMVNLPIELHDVIELDTLPYYNDTYITCDDMRLMSARSNLCTRAVAMMREHYGFKENFMIHIHKEIPFSAGLGGGSSNGAMVMRALNQMLHIKASEEDLAKIGVHLGADVPYFFFGKPAKVEGIGEIITPITPKRVYHCLIVKPDIGLSTKDVYEASERFEKEEIDTAKVIQCLEEGDELGVARAMGNDLFRPAVSLCPVVGEIVGRLRKDGFPIAAMSGSGSAVFALSLDQKKLKEEAKIFEKLGHQVILTKTMK